MIYIDSHEKAPGPQGEEKLTALKIAALIQRIGVRSEVVNLPYGDYCFEGLDPMGTGGLISVAIERKRLHDMMTCVHDSRYASHQRIGMDQLYHYNLLIIEGLWKPHDPNGTLMEGFPGDHWREFSFKRQRAMYSSLRRYLFSVQLAGVPVLYTRDLFQTAFDVCECYHYFQKKKHDSLLSKHKLNIPALSRRPPLVQRWAMELDGVDIVIGERAADLFKTPIALATASWIEWTSIKGVSLDGAVKLERQIEGTL